MTQITKADARRNFKNQNSSISNKEIEHITKNFPIKKTSCPDDFAGEAVSPGS